MSDQNITQLPSLTAPSDSDLLYILDVSDTTDGLSGSDKSITVANLKTIFGYSLPIQNVTSESAKLALSGLYVGQRVKVNFNTNGSALYQYEGGGESTESNWTLISNIWVSRSTNDNTTLTNNAIFTNDTQLQIDYVPVGTYAVELRFTVDCDTGGGGIKWRLNTDGTMIAYQRGTYIWSNAASDSGFEVSNMFNGMSHAIESATFSFCAIQNIQVSVAGNLIVQFAQNTSNSINNFLYAGSSLRLSKIE